MNGKPRITIQPGNYFVIDPAVKWIGDYNCSDIIQTQGLTVAQVGQSEVMVVLDPQNRVFIIRNGGFVSYGSSGMFKVVEVVVRKVLN